MKLGDPQHRNSWQRLIASAAGNIPQASIDAILADRVTSLAIPGRVACTLTINDVGLAAPSVAGHASITTLEAAGWPAVAHN